MGLKRFLFLVLFVFTSVSAFSERGVFNVVEKAAKELKVVTKKAEEIGEKSKAEEQNVRGNNGYPYVNQPATAPRSPRRYVPGKIIERSRDADDIAKAKIIKCPVCKGTGKNRFGNTCKICKGSGMVSVSNTINNRTAFNNMNNIPQQPSKKSSPLRTIGIIALILCGVFFLFSCFKR